ncbi:MAG: 16S rRNA (guanine(966)-N(2))-methyltransferase RsmD [candidate division WOR-3 bacterium]
MGIRIIGGDLKNRELLRKGIKKEFVRPTTAIVRKSIFDSLGEIKGFTVLDLFAGSGILGIESISRGAEKVVFVEKDRYLIENLKENLKRLNLLEKGFFYNTDFEKAVKVFDEKKEKFDLIFIDPPYRLNSVYKPLKVLSEKKILNENGLIVYLSYISEKIDHERFKIFKEKKFGITKISFLKE